MNKQNGFAHAVALLVAVLILAIGGIGYYVWHKNHKNNPAATTTTAVSAAIVSASSSSSTSELTQNFLVIKQWGVKLPLTSQLSDAYYLLKDGFVYLSVNSLAATGCSADSTTLGAISRFTATDVDTLSGQTKLSENPNAVKIGQYYYEYTHPQSQCSETVSTQQKADTDMGLFAAAVANLQAE